MDFIKEKLNQSTINMNLNKEHLTELQKDKISQETIPYEVMTIYLKVLYSIHISGNKNLPDYDMIEILSLIIKMNLDNYVENIQGLVELKFEGRKNTKEYKLAS